MQQSIASNRAVILGAPVRARTAAPARRVATLAPVAASRSSEVRFPVEKVAVAGLLAIQLQLAMSPAPALALTDEAKAALMAEARAKAAAQAQAQAPIAAAPPATSEQTSRFITAPELSDRDGIDARNLTRGDADADGFAAATYDAASAPSDASSEAAAAPPTATYVAPPPGALPEPENPENVNAGGGVFGLFQSGGGGSEEPQGKKFGLF